MARINPSFSPRHTKLITAYAFIYGMDKSEVIVKAWEQFLKTDIPLHVQEQLIKKFDSMTEEQRKYPKKETI